jgi:four helix bundle suffix protein
LEELRGDYQDFLRQRGLEEWPPYHPALVRFKSRRCATVEALKAWVEDERKRARTNRDKHGRAQATSSVGWSVKVRAGPCGRAPSSAQLVANAALSLLNLCCYLLDRQLDSLAKAFLEEGGFTERLYRLRSKRRNRG